MDGLMLLLGYAIGLVVWMGLGWWIAVRVRGAVRWAVRSMTERAAETAPLAEVAPIDLWAMRERRREQRAARRAA